MRAKRANLKFNLESFEYFYGYGIKQAPHSDMDLFQKAEKSFSMSSFKFMLEI